MSCRWARPYLPRSGALGGDATRLRSSAAVALARVGEACMGGVRVRVKVRVRIRVRVRVSIRP